MNKTELVEKVVTSTGLSKTQADAALNAFIEAVTDALKTGDKVSLKGFGTFEVRSREERVGRNPRTGESMTIPSSRVPAFKASSALKSEVNK